MSVNIHHGDCVTWARQYSGEPFHALMCDPPYHLISPGNDGGATRSMVGSAGPYQRTGRGFMGKQWDGGDVAFDPATWEAFKRIMYPGAFGMAFASSRGWHRLAVAIEDAGFVIHPSLFGWSYGSGFPKATRVNGSTPEQIKAMFISHRYGLQALKPALEPIIVFQKPYEGRPVDNITATGAGVLAIDAARIGLADGEECKPMKAQGTVNSIIGQSGRYEDTTELKANGRWPANFYLGDPEAAARLDEQSGTLTSGNLNAGHKRGDGVTVAYGGGGIVRGNYGGDSGGASRFFFTVREQLDDADPVKYCAKASRRERDAGLEGMPLREQPSTYGDIGPMEGNPRKVNTGHIAQVRNVHPTVKPLALARYLATLLLPPAEYAPRRIFVPFAGVASECIGAMQAGWEQVTGVELTEEYIPIAQARVEHWQGKPEQMELMK